MTMTSSGAPRAAGDLESDGHAAARQAKDHDALISQVLQPAGQAPSRVSGISENNGYP